MVRDLLTTDTMKWGELLEQALRHKMFPMLAHQIMPASLRFDVPTNIYMHLESALEWNRWQIEVFRRETVRVAQALADRGIPFVVTKGMAFESTLYDSLGTRYMNDIDFMITPRDRDKVMTVMQKLGFRPFFDWAKDARREEISSRLNPDHLPKLAREIDQPGIRLIDIDIANSLTWTKSPFDVPVEEALENPVEQSIPGMSGISLGASGCAGLSAIPGIPGIPAMPAAAAFIWLSESIRKLPEVTTRSPPLTPDRICTRSPLRSPVFTCLGSK